MQGGHLTSPAKSDWISIIWTGLSLLQEQGGYYSLAGRINRTIASIGVMDLVRSRVTVTSNSPLARESCCDSLASRHRTKRRRRPGLATPSSSPNPCIEPSNNDHSPSITTPYLLISRRAHKSWPSGLNGCVGILSPGTHFGVLAFLGLYIRTESRSPRSYPRLKGS